MVGVRTAFPSLLQTPVTTHYSCHHAKCYIRCVRIACAEFENASVAFHISWAVDPRFQLRWMKAANLLHEETEEYDQNSNDEYEGKSKYPKRPMRCCPNDKILTATRPQSYSRPQRSSYPATFVRYQS